MSDLLNNPMILSIVFPALTVLGTLPLLRWAISGEKADIFASLSVGLACLIGLVCAYGRPGEPFQHGMGAMVYAIGMVSVCALLYVAWLKNLTLRLVCMAMTIVVWGWMFAGMPMSMHNIMIVSFSVGAFLMFVFILCLRVRWDFYQHNEAVTPFIALLVISGTLWLIAGFNEAQAAQNFAIALCVTCIGCLIWSIPRFGFSFHENAFLPLTLSVAALIWDMLLKDMLPLVSLACLTLVLFTRPATVKMLSGRSEWIGKAFYVIFGLMCLLPAFLSVIFFDVLRNL